ncbi:adenylate/guanylate cyclase domain-containing protein [Rhizobium laguerreae]|nr:adenylate/guanylate cyclase domain-containing protein [Rhizobium laguerreae]MBY3402827.1 adenylate/guanylate cyclase domain-containing protein [Rhizobium laguerreae]MBY3409766.1 adenylate/guanylate cyclase domain-containing protein [Rhizobium laguerreae]MBY3513804.1 adenylate/guanylate cyclase domain-containing protein [Rhizobium laguerreae]
MISETAARRSGYWLIVVVLAMLAGLPLAVWLDISDLSGNTLRRQARDMSSLISSIRSYYSANVVGRVLAAHASGATAGTVVSHNYANISGAIPLPATLSLELGDVIKEQQANITYRFVSDLPFKSRASHDLDDFERRALAELRANPQQTLNDLTRVGLSDIVRFITPVLMGQACVACHNSHPESPKTDWKVGDVRGIQEVVIKQPYVSNVFAFKYLLCYFLFVAIIGLSFILLQRQQARAIHSANRDLEAANEFLASVSLKIPRYLSPQIYKSIFSGQKDVVVHTERKRLTIFFSDIKDFTATTERLQPEALTEMLNEYLTEMSNIALEHGGTVDKFIGDAMLVFFGDPDTKGPEEDAKACLRMAVDMQRRLGELKDRWRRNGTEEPFVVRMGINSGYCNVGNFGSSDRMDYTIIGAEANLAARLQSIAEGGEIVISYETYALVNEIVDAHPLPPITMKGIQREIVPYGVDGLTLGADHKSRVLSEHLSGLDLHLDISRLEPADRLRVRTALKEAIAALDEAQPEAAGS